MKKKIKKLSRLQLKNVHGLGNQEDQSAYDEAPKDCYLNWIVCPGNGPARVVGPNQGLKCC